jgi:hypothetical protein
MSGGARWSRVGDSQEPGPGLPEMWDMGFIKSRVKEDLHLENCVHLDQRCLLTPYLVPYIWYVWYLTYTLLGKLFTPASKVALSCLLEMAAPLNR